MDPFGMLKDQRPGDVAYLGADGVWRVLHKPTAAAILQHLATDAGPSWLLKTAASSIDHGGLAGLTDDDHTQYLKEEASGGLASEVPDHTHADGSQAGTVAHSALTGVTANQHHNQSHALTGSDHTTDAWTGYTPTVTQGGTVTSFTTNTSKYKKIDRVVIAQGRITINNAGTAAGANDVTVSLPVTALDGTLEYSTTGAIFDSSANLIYAGAVRKASTTTLKLITIRTGTAPLSAAGAVFLGSIDFTAALATGDVIDFCIVYEAAS
ncbi:MAG TPA: hypothetical protein VLA89_14190 [Gemmatimonadales bacterium]|nr:hypothetical protein [Gemmatimonadales bacterium]